MAITITAEVSEVFKTSVAGGNDDCNVSVSKIQMNWLKWKVFVAFRSFNLWRRC